jgi:hypothetical protein
MVSASSLEWVLRVGAFLCFVGHGAFGIIGKEAWLPYFAVAGIDAPAARALEPWIGIVDIVVGCTMLLAPRKAVAWWMVVWALWTAMLRPLAGEPFWEMLERGGNYGVPAAIVLLLAPATSLRAAFATARWRSVDDALLARVRIALLACVACLLVGHGVLCVISKPMFVTNFSAVMSRASASALVPYLGWLEILLAVVMTVRPSVPLLVFIALWKLATEMLFVAAGAPIWEVVERGGSYAGPIALAIVLSLEAVARDRA